MVNCVPLTIVLIKYTVPSVLILPNPANGKSVNCIVCPITNKFVLLHVI